MVDSEWFIRDIPFFNLLFGYSFHGAEINQAGQVGETSRYALAGDVNIVLMMI